LAELKRPAQRLTRATLTSAVAHLTRRDRGLARIVRTHGVPPLWARPPGFATLVRIILEQQVSLASARAMYGRVANQLPGGWTTKAVLRGGTASLMSRGITRQKAGYIVALATRIEGGDLVLRRLARGGDDHACEQLIACPGIGPWTAGIYLLMALRRPDVWPPGDVALQNALGRMLGVTRPLTSDDAVRYAARWTPYRSVAARILWCGYLGERSSARQKAKPTATPPVLPLTGRPSATASPSRRRRWRATSSRCWP
jgi:DNA-3-methyladenine glycosylase II